MRRALIPVVFLVACASAEEPRKAGEPPPGDVPFHLVVSNRSGALDPVHIDVDLDGIFAVTGDFQAGSRRRFHQFDFDMAGGVHRLAADGELGRVRLDQEFSLDTESWGVLLFWFEDGGPPRFSWQLQKERPALE